MQTKEEMQQQLSAWEKQLPSGYAVTPENVNLLLEDIVAHESGIFTVESLNRATTRVSKNPSWSWAPPEKTAEEIEFERLSALNPAAAHWFHNQNTLVKDTRGLSALIAELQGRQVSNETIFQAIGRLQHRPGCPLTFVPAKAHEGGYGRHSDAKFEDSKSSERYKNGRLNHAFKDPTETAATPTPDQNNIIGAQVIAKGLLNSESRHSHNAALDEVYAQGVNKTATWGQVLDRMKAYKRSVGNVQLPTAKF